MIIGSSTKTLDKNESESPPKCLRKTTRGLLGMSSDSPQSSEVSWSYKNSSVCEVTLARIVGGKGKQKSSNVLLESPQSSIKRSKRSVSSPLLSFKNMFKGVMTQEPQFDETEEVRMIERELKMEEYEPRNLLNELEDNEALNESVTMDIPMRAPSPKPKMFTLDDFEPDLSAFSDQEDFLAEFEKEEQKILEKMKAEANSKTSGPASTSNKCNYFESDDEEDDILSSIPIELLTNAPPVDAKTVNIKYDSATHKSQIVFTTHDQNESKQIISKKPEAKGGLQAISAKTNETSVKMTHSSVIPPKREPILTKNSTSTGQRQTNFKDSATISNHQQPAPAQPRKCTAEEIARKRQAAMARRQRTLQNLQANR